MERHCVTCTCEREMDEIGIYPPHEGFYGRCDRCGEVRWGTDRNIGGCGEPIRKTHCGCCTHLHNLPPGGHDERCLADEANCILVG